ncbi:MAG: DMT family transporter [Bacteroidales bacterium]|nr:DMT family transporter [Bacteroidales bacterium]
MQKQKKAYIYALTAVLFWATIGSAFKLTLRYVDFIHILLYASFISIILLFSILWIQKKTILLRSITKKDILRSAGLGFLNPYLYYLTVLKAYDLLLAQEAVVINYVWPITLVLLSIPMLKQKISLKSFLAILISFAGVVIIAIKGNLSLLHFSNIEGVLLALVSTVFWALFFILNVKDKRDAVLKMLLNFIFGFIYVLITIAIFYGIKIPNIEGIIGSIYIGIFEMGIAFVIWLKSLQLSSSTAKVSNLIFLSPLLSLIFVSLIVGEQIMGYSIAGFLFIMGGIILQRFTK